jgi:uncharacterized membrane protein YcaP (DUF421 family)
MTAGRQSPAPQFGDDERFDRAAHRLRMIAWWIVLPLLAVGAFTNQAENHAVPSAVLRAAIIYGFVLLIVRLAGKRTLAELSTFDLVVLLIMSEAIQPALVAEDTRITSAMLLVSTFVALDFFLAMLKDKSPGANRALDDIPTVLVRDGKVNHEALTRERVDEEDIMEAARRDHGLERFEQVRFAILERTGGISIIPWPEAAPTLRAR